MRGALDNLICFWHTGLVLDISPVHSDNTVRELSAT